MECPGVLGRSWNYEIPLVFDHIVLTKTLGVIRSSEIRAGISRRMELWEKGLHTGLVGDAEAEGNVREARYACGGEEEDENTGATTTQCFWVI